MLNNEEFQKELQQIFNLKNLIDTHSFYQSFTELTSYAYIISTWPKSTNLHP